MIKNCFEFDWGCSKMPKFIKNEEDLKNTKEVLRSYYKQIKDTYKQYASISPSQDVWSISTTIFLDFVMEINIVDNKTLKLSDIDVKFTATNSATEFKNNPRNPERNLIDINSWKF